MAHFHPAPELLIDYAAGALPEGPSLVIATHLALCPDCRREVARLEALGGALLESACEELPVSASCREQVMARLDTSAPMASEPVDLFLCRVLPAPLRHYVGCGLGDIKWEKLTRTVERVELGGCHEGRAQLLRIKAGAPMPKHTHGGLEYTLVLQGNFRDESGLYRRGDLAVCDGSVTHAPVAGETEDCVCLVVTEGPLKLSGLMGKLISPFVRF
jgi:putative transcriptional regulator